MITPSFALTATERVLPKLALDFTTANLDSRVTFTRSGNTATVINSSGYVVPINADLPRFDYNPVTLVCRGLLIEESRTNVVLSSGDLRAALEGNAVTAWGGTSVSIATANAGTSPDGTNNATKVAATATSAAHSRTQTFSFTSGVTYTVSVFAKADEWTTLQISLGAAAFSGLQFGNYVLTTGASTAGNGASIAMQNFGNGWYRCSITVTATATASTAVNLSIYNSTNPGRASSILGDGTSGIFMFGGQLEVGAFPTSYIPTVASQVTRTADVATMTGTNFSDWYSAGVGGLVALVLPSTVSGTRPAIQFDDATADEIIALRGNTTNPELYIKDGGADQAQIDAGTIAANTAYNLGAAWDTNNCAAAVNGGAAVTDTTATIPTVTQARLGSDGTNYFNGHLQTLRYWPQRLINAEVQAFSK